MSRHGRLRQLQHRHQIADAELVLLEKKSEDAQTRLVVQGLEYEGDVFHGGNYIRNMDIVKNYSGGQGWAVPRQFPDAAEKAQFIFVVQAT